MPAFYTFLFTDIQGSTRLWEAHPDQMQSALARHNDILAESVAPHGGEIVKSTGDGVLAIFSAGQPMQAAFDIQRAFLAETWPSEIGDFLIRVGLHAGQAEPIGSDYYGSDVNRAARVMDAAWGGQILVTAAARQVGDLPAGADLLDLGAHRLKDLADPIQLYCLTHPDLPSDFPPIRSLSAHPNNLPIQPTPFIGRRDDLADIGERLTRTDCRLVTLLGPGGMGKTRLGLQTGSEHIEDFRHGVYFVPLAPVDSADTMVSTIAGSLRFGLAESHDTREQLIQYLAPRDMLLILDNFEHLLAGADLVSDIVQHAPGVKVIATSRARLNLASECVYEVEGMARPDDESATVFADFEAVELFVTYARRARPDYSLRDEDRAAVARICQLVEGMPLGLELAANWVRALSPQDIAEELAADIDLLEAERADIPLRHRSMRAAFNYSWVLLNEAEQDVLMKLSVFRGGCTREAAKAVAGAGVRTLASLVDQSLLKLNAEGRYSIHELIRQFAAERLQESGESDAVNDTHAVHYATVAEREAANLCGGDQRGALDRCTADFENLRAAWRWAVDQGDADSIDRLIDALHLYCRYSNRIEDGIELFDRARACWDAHQPDAPAIAGRVLVRFPDPAADAISDLELALQLARDQGNRGEEAFCLRFLGLHGAHWSGHDREKVLSGIALLEESLAIYRELGDRYHEAHVLDDIAFPLGMLGDGDGQFTHIQQSLDIRRAIGDRIGMGNNLRGLGSWTYDYERGTAYLDEAYQIAEEMDDRVNLAWIASMRVIAGFYSGRFGEAREAIERAIPIVADVIDPRVQIIVAIFDILLTSVETRDYQTGYDQLSALFRQHPDWQDYPELMNFGVLAYSFIQIPLGRVEETIRYFDEMEGLSWGDDANVTMILPILAVFIAERGDAQRATELLARGMTDPERILLWLDAWHYMDELKQSLRDALGDEAYERAWDAGTRLDLATLTPDILDEYL